MILRAIVCFRFLKFQTQLLGCGPYSLRVVTPVGITSFIIANKTGGKPQWQTPVAIPSGNTQWQYPAANPSGTPSYTCRCFANTGGCVGGLVSVYDLSLVGFFVSMFCKVPRLENLCTSRWCSIRNSKTRHTLRDFFYVFNNTFYFDHFTISSKKRGGEITYYNTTPQNEHERFLANREITSSPRDHELATLKTL